MSRTACSDCVRKEDLARVFFGFLAAVLFGALSVSFFILLGAVPDGDLARELAFGWGAIFVVCAFGATLFTGIATLEVFD